MTHHTKDQDQDTLSAIQEAMNAGREKQQKDLHTRMQLAAKTTALRDKHPRTKDRTSTMGEGMGNAMGLEGPKYDVGWTEVQPEPAAPTDEEIAAAVAALQEKRKATAAKSKRTRELNVARRATLKAAEEAGKVLLGKRVFMVTEAFEDFDIRAKRFGGIPEGVDIARTEFCSLVSVPVIEAEEGKKMGLDSPRRDIDGRIFWIKADIIEQVATVFGGVDWRRPLTKNEVEKQFKVKLLG